MLASANNRLLVSGIGMAHYPGGRIIVQDPGQAMVCCLTTIANDDHAGVLRIADTNAAAMVERNPSCTAGTVEQGIQQRPIGNGIGAVAHRLGFPIGTGDGA